MMSAALLGLIADTLIGDPRSSWHPVVLIGKLIACLERRLLNNAASPRSQIAAGGCLVFIVLASVCAAAYGIVSAAALGGPKLFFAVNALLFSFTISPRALAEAGLEIKRYLQSGDLANARFKVGWIVGRDTENLDVPNITRATVETVAENTVDGVISPLIYFLLGGAPLAFLYRAVNTLDSMVAYKNERYLYFGRIAAYTDDLFNYIPARVTGLCIVAAAFLLRFDAGRAWKTLRRDAAGHPSPNGGWSEAPVAGALGVQLGGLNYYFGQPHLRARMGDPVHTLSPRHITQTIQIMYTVTALIFILAYFGAVILRRFCS